MHRRSFGTAATLAALALAACLGSAARAQPQSPEFRINTTVADSQSTARGGARGRCVSRSGNGSFVVVWQSALQDGEAYGIYGQRYNATGAPQGGEFRINTVAAGSQTLPSVSLDNNGNFAVAWSGNGPGDADGIFARLYDAAGNPRGTELRVNAAAAGVQDDADVALDNGGDLVVVWSGNGAGDTSGIFGRRFNSAGTPLTGEFRVNADTTGVQSHPAVATDSNGDFVVVWESPRPTGDVDLYFQRFTDSAGRQGPQTLVHAATAGNQTDPGVARASNGDFVVVWESASTTPGPDDPDVLFRRFGRDGSPQGGDEPATAPAGAQQDPALDVVSSGHFLIAWSSDDDPSPQVDWNIRLQQFDKYGNRVGSEVLVNETQAGEQIHPGIGLDDIDHFTVVWSGNGPGDADGIFGRLFQTQVFADLSVSKTVSDSLVPSGQTTAFTITVTNAGPGIATGIQITDLLPAGLSYVSDIANQGIYTSGTGIWDVGSLLAFDTAALVITARVDAPGGTTLTNSANLTAMNGIDPVAGNNSASAGVAVERPVRVLAEPQAPQPLLPGGPHPAVFRLRIVNGTAAPETLRALSFTNTTSGPGTSAELDAEWTGAKLETASPPAVLATRSFSGGRLVFDNLALALAPGDSASLVVRAGASLLARDGDVLDLRIDAAADLVLSGVPVVQAQWPLDPPGGFPVDGMSAAQVVVQDVSGNLYAGSTRNLVLDFTLPANGYEADRLEKLNLVNLGTARDSLDIARLEAWVDDGDGNFAAVADRLLGALAFTGNRWEITGLVEPVGPAGSRIFVSADIASAAGVGRTVRLGAASDNDVAIGMASGNDGPIDGPVSNRLEQSISTDDRITLTPAALASGTVRPGARRLPLLHLVATNSYTTDKRLTGITLTDVSTTANGGTRAQLDGVLEMLALSADGDQDGMLDDPAVDPVLGTSFFSQGRASFGGLAWDIPAGMTQQLFVTGDVALAAAADGDVLGVQVAGGLELQFADPTAVTASWPLDSGARWTVDGMIGAQIGNRGAPGATLGPGDGPVLALDVVVPANGYAGDVLNGVTLQNLGSATASALADVRLWRDGGDGVFTPGAGDDRDVAPLVLVGAGWKSPQLDEPLASPGARFFVGVTISATPADSSSLRFGIPMRGLEVASGNDGPVDAAVVNPEALVLSSAPLLATLSTSPAPSNVGQDFQVRMDVRNVSRETITGIAPSRLLLAGSASATPVAGAAPGTFDLSPGFSATFEWTYRGVSAGTLAFSGSAAGTGLGGLPRRSLYVQSPAHQLLLAADSLLVQPVGSMPFSLNRGETDVVPLSLTLTNTGDANTSAIQVRWLRLRIEDDAGNGIVPADILSRLAVIEGATTYAATTALPESGDEIMLAFGTPLSVTPSEPATINLRCDILATTLVQLFRLAILDGSWIGAEDATQHLAVGVGVRQGSFPIRSGLGRVRAAPTELRVQAASGTSTRVSRGQREAALLRLQLQNPGIADLTSSVRMGSLELVLADTTGTAQVDAARFLTRLSLKSGALMLDERTLAASPDTSLGLVFALPALVPAGSTTELVVLADLAETSPLGRFRLRLGEPASIEARDENTSEAVPVVYAATPLQGDAFAIEGRADSLHVAATPSFPPSLMVGEVGRTALVARLRHPGGASTGRIRITSWSVSCRDEARRQLSAERYIDRLRLLRDGTELAVVTQMPAAGAIDVPLDLLLEPGANDSLALVVDLEATSPASFLEIVVQSVAAADANVGVPVFVAPEAGNEMPLTSGLTKLASPPTELVVNLESQIPAVLVGNGAPVPLARLVLQNTAAAGAGTIQVDHLVLRAADRAEQPIALGLAAAQVLAYSGTSLWAASGTLSADSATVTLQPQKTLLADPGERLQLNIVAVFHADPGVDGFRLGVDASGVGVRQPPSALLAIRVEPASERTFPLWTEPGSFSGATLRESFANFPNPFAAGREPTTFVYYLPSPSRVSLRILTPRGETVSELLQNVTRPAGLHQVDTWRGRNGRGLLVTNGVYLAELVVQLADGTRERLFRKVAVVR